MEILEYSSQNPEVIRIKGALDNTAWEIFRPIIQKTLMHDVQQLQVDLQEVENATSAGLAVLELLHTILSARGGVLTLLNPQEYLKQYLVHHNFSIEIKP